jgi:hypothetical protein
VGDGILLGFADAPLLLATLRSGDERSDDPEVQARWLRAAGVEEAR